MSRIPAFGLVVAGCVLCELALAQGFRCERAADIFPIDTVGMPQLRVRAFGPVSCRPNLPQPARPLALAVSRPDELLAIYADGALLRWHWQEQSPGVVKSSSSPALSRDFPELQAAAFSARSEWLAVATRPSSGAAKLLVMQVRNARSKEVLLPSPAVHLRWSSDARKLVSAHQDGKVRLWSRDLSLLSEFQPFPADAFAVEISADGTWLAAIGRSSLPHYHSGSLLIWRAGGEGRAIEVPVVHEFHKTYYTALAFSPDGKQLATGQEDGRMQLLELNDQGEWRLLWSWREPPERNAFTLQIHALNFSRDGELLLVGNGRNAKTSIYELRSRKSLGAVYRAGDEETHGVAQVSTGHLLSFQRGGSVAHEELFRAVATNAYEELPKELTLEETWVGFFSPSAEVGRRAEATLVQHPEWLAGFGVHWREMLAPVPEGLSKDIDPLIEELIHENWQVRAQARQKLEELYTASGSMDVLVVAGLVEKRLRHCTDETLCTNLRLFEESPAAEQARILSVRFVSALESLAARGNSDAQQWLGRWAGSEKYDFLARKAAAAWSRVQRLARSTPPSHGP